MIYEIINPSDPYTIKGEFKIAVLSTIVLGEGMYSLQPESGDEEHMPLFLFGGAMEWLKERFGQDFDLPAAIHAHAVEIADCLDTVLIGSFGDRRTYEDGLSLITEEPNRIKWRDRWLDERRSSMNNIGGRAYQLAVKLREAHLLRMRVEDGQENV